MLKTVHIGRVLGIDSYIHWSFWILLIWIGISESVAHGLLLGLFATALVLVLFACVFLHELGHAMAARAYRIGTRDITLLPFGGLARLETPPPSGVPEIVIALAGPAVNVVIAAILWLWLALTNNPTQLANNLTQLPPLQQILYVNLFLAAFNMLPAFPMDGGRVLRSLLAIRFGNLQATSIAAQVGKYLAIAMIVFGLFYSWSLVLVGLFVWGAGYLELLQTRAKTMFDTMQRDMEFNFGGRDDSVVDGQVIDADDIRHIGDR